MNEEDTKDTVDREFTQTAACREEPTPSVTYDEIRKSFMALKDLAERYPDKIILSMIIRGQDSSERMLLCNITRPTGEDGKIGVTDVSWMAAQGYALESSYVVKTMDAERVGKGIELLLKNNDKNWGDHGAEALKKLFGLDI